MSILPAAATVAEGVKRLLQDTAASRYTGFMWVNAAKKTLIGMG